MDSQHFSEPHSHPRPIPSPFESTSGEQWLPAGTSRLFLPASQQYEPTYHPQEPASRASGSAYHPPNPQLRDLPPSGTPLESAQGHRGGGGDQIDAYIHIPCIFKLYEAHCGLSKTVTNLCEENQELRAKMARLEQQLDQQCQISQPPLDGPGPVNYAQYRRALSGSLAPSDSFSQRLSRQSSGSLASRDQIQDASYSPALRTPQPQPATRPPEFPEEILWQKDDCKLDKQGARPEKSNSGRPRMKYAIREKDGRKIDGAYYKAIQKTVATQVAVLIQEEEERLKGRLPVDKMTKTYFETVRPKQWMHAIAVIEAEHLILTYAAAHWKAEQLLTKCLTSKRSSNKNRSGRNPHKKVKRSTKSTCTSREEGGTDSTEEEDSEDEGNDGSSVGKDKTVTGSKRKRARSQTETTLNAPETSDTVEHGSLMDFDAATTQEEMPNIPTTTPTQAEAPPSQHMVQKRLGKQKQAAFAAISEAALSINGPQDNSMETTLRPPRTSPISLISVDATYDGTKDVLTSTFQKNMPPHAIELLDALEKISGTAALNNSSPSSAVIQFIERIEFADPNMPDIDEDDTNIGWGHYQFTAGGLTCRSVLQSWSDIGNVKTAYRLLAASLKTCLVARHLCFTNKILVREPSTSYISDAYLREVVEILWDFRVRAQDSASNQTVACETTESSQTVASAASAAPLEPIPQDQDAITNKGLTQQLERLHAEELKTWMSRHSIPLPAHNKRKKGDLIALILRAGGEKIPSEEDVTHIVGQRVPHKRNAAVKPN